jgi:hypothetical protein
MLGEQIVPPGLDSPRPPIFLHLVHHVDVSQRGHHRPPPVTDSCLLVAHAPPLVDTLGKESTLPIAEQSSNESWGFVRLPDHSLGCRHRPNTDPLSPVEF